MQAESEKHDTAMAAVVKLTAEEATQLCRQFSDVYPVNFNCPGQTTVSGLSEQMPGFFAAVKAAGGRAIPLKVKGAFHSPYMAEAAKAFGQELAKAGMKLGNIPLYSNVTAAPYEENPAALLAKQIESPVQWEKLIQTMISAGIDTFVEIGPGKTLTNMIHRIDGKVNAYSVTEYLEEISC